MALPLFSSGAVALLELFLAAARAGIVAPDFLQRVAHGLLVRMAAMRAVYMAVISVIVAMIMVVVAIGAMDMGLLVHR